MAEAVQLSLEFGSEAVDLDVLEEAASQMRRALADIESRVTSADPKAVWRWADQAVLRVEATPNGVSTETLRRVVADFHNAFERVEEADGAPIQWPETLGPRARKAVEQIVSFLEQEDIDYISLAVPDQPPLTIDHAILHKEVGHGGRFYVELSSIDGKLDLISVRGTPSFSIEEHGTGRRIRCIFPDDLFERVKDALGSRIVVEGLVRFRRSNGSPVSISQVTSLFIRPEPSRSMEDLIGALPRFTGGTPSDEYIRRLRSAPETE